MSTDSQPTLSQPSQAKSSQGLAVKLQRSVPHLNFCLNFLVNGSVFGVENH